MGMEELRQQRMEQMGGEDEDQGEDEEHRN